MKNLPNSNAGCNCNCNCRWLLLGLLSILAAQLASAVPEISIDDPVELPLNGTNQAFFIDIANVGAGGNLTVSAASFNGNANFSVTSLPDPIIPGDRDVIGISFKPLGENGAFSAQLTIDSDDPATPVKTITVSGAIHDPMVLAPTRVDIGNSRSHTITMGNGGEERSLKVDFINLSGDTSFFKLTKIPLPFSLIPAGGTAEIKFNFTPGDRKGKFQLILNVFTDDPIVRPFIIEVNAEVPEDPPFAVTEIQLSADGEEVTLKWNSQTDTSYVIDRSTDLAAAWVEIQGAVPSDGAETSFIDQDLPADEGRVFYRVRLADP